MNFPAKKIEIIALKDKQEDVLEELQLSSLVEVISFKKDSEEPDFDFENKKNKIDLALAEMRFARNFLLNFAEKESFVDNILNSFHIDKAKYTFEEIKNLVDSKTEEDLTEKTHQIEKSLNQIKSQKELLEREINELKKFSGISINTIESFKNFDIFIGSILDNRKETLINTLKEKSIFFFIKWGGEEDCKQIGFCMIYAKEDNMAEIAKSAGAKEETIFWTRPPHELLKEKRAEIEELNRKQIEREKEAKQLTEVIPKLEALIDWYSWEADKIETLKKSEATKNYFYLKAWVLESNIKEVEKTIKDITSFFMVQEIPLEEGEVPPVKMENKDLMASFEVITNVYGAPKPNEPDPTPFLAPFFAVAFGLALSDAGYGILLIILSFLMSKKMKGAESFFNLFIVAGAFTVVAGLLTGTFFGTDAFAQYRFVDPVSDPIEVLFLVSIFGLLQIFVGLLVGFFWHLKQGDKNTAFGKKASSAIFFVGLAFTAILGNPNFVIAGILLMMLLAIIFSSEKNVVKRIFGGFGSLYGLIGFFSDTLSYSRLLALGLATGIIAMTINMIALIFMDMIPVAGLNVAVAGLVLVVGHIANLLINALSSFIHAARLQFVEFFSKFMEGGGRKFKPFSKQGRFIQIIK